jgi:hypothetical protein
MGPDQFIPLAEEIGLIDELGEWILRTACAEAATWPADVKIAINLSPAQFRRGDLAGIITSALDRSGLAADQLELEITESVLLQKSEGNLATLHAIKRLGASIVLDDFGTGYSSLGYLRISLRQDQDRPAVRAGAGERTDCGHRLRDHRARPQPQHRHHRRRGRDRGAALARPRGRLHQVQGFLFGSRGRHRRCRGCRRSRAEPEGGVAPALLWSVGPPQLLSYPESHSHDPKNTLTSVG